MRVIINADDCGLNTEVNFVIEKCIQQGLITSTTIMAAGDGFEDAVKLAKRYPDISFGVHLTLDALQSLTKSPILKEYGLTDETGFFIKGAIFRVDKWTDELKMAVQQELETQINKVIEAGVNPSHFDGHHHCHTEQALEGVMVNLTKEFGIYKVRVPLDSRTFDMIIHHITPAASKRKLENTAKSEKIQKGNSKMSTIDRVLRNVNMFKTDYFFKHHFQTTDYCCSVSSFLKNEDYMIRKLSNRVIELMCHPGHPDYEEETQQLEKISNKLIRISYNDI